MKDGIYYVNAIRVSGRVQQLRVVADVEAEPGQAGESALVSIKEARFMSNRRRARLEHWCVAERLCIYEQIRRVHDGREQLRPKVEPKRRAPKKAARPAAKKARRR